MAQDPVLLGGRYEVGSVLGRGGMAEVRRAHDTRLGRDVAIKMLRTDLAGDPTFQARFRREAQAAAGLNHPNIVSVYDTGVRTDDSGTEIPYIVMELVEGRTLRDVLRDGRRILPERAFEIERGVLDALAYSHKAGIIHRDIKPANVMLTSTGLVKVMDFGIARAVSDTQATMTQTAAVIGTAQYLSPEQARGETVDARSDLYSAGCLLYELLASRPPFIGDSPVSVAYQHVRETPVAPSQVGDGDDMITADMDAIVLKSLAKDPADRYQSAKQMRDDITRLLDGQPVEAGVPTAFLPAAAAGGAIAGAAAVADANPSPVPATAYLPPPGDPQPQRAITPTEPPEAEAALATGTAPAVTRHRRTPGWLVALIVVLALALVGAIGFLGWQLTRPAEPATPSSQTVVMVNVPSVRGYSLEAAQSTLENAGLRMKATTVQGADDTTVNQVIQQDPPSGTPVVRGTEVTVTINAGQTKVVVPDVVGATEQQARSMLAMAGFDATKITTRQASSEPATAKRGQVTAVSPGVGSSVAKTSSIVLTLATGQGAMPNLNGRTEDQARSDLAAAGFTGAVTVQHEATSTAVEGRVFRQSPDPGTTVAKDTAVTITIADAAPTPPPVTTASPAPSRPSSRRS